jgi:hypothetical protein
MLEPCSSPSYAAAGSQIYTYDKGKYSNLEVDHPNGCLKAARDHLLVMWSEIGARVVRRYHRFAYICNGAFIPPIPNTTVREPLISRLELCDCCYTLNVPFLNVLYASVRGMKATTCAKRIIICMRNENASLTWHRCLLPSIIIHYVSALAFKLNQPPLFQFPAS